MRSGARRLFVRSVLRGLLAAGLGLGAVPQAPAQVSAARVQITSAVVEAQSVRLPGNTRPEANARNDRGRVADSMPLEHMLLLLRRPAERELDLQRFIRQLHDRSSPLYHHWLGAAEFGQRFGLAPQDLAAITTWLAQHGFTVHAVSPSTMMIDFSGTAGAVRGAFRTEIHALDVRGERHIANMSDPLIPLALAPAVVGIVSLHDFRPRAAMHRARPAYTLSSAEHLVVPYDLATIYNLNPLLTSGVTGQGQTIVVIEDTNVFQTGDWNTFRSVFGLSGYSTGSFTQVHPAGASSCTNPGVNGNEGEAILDAEWASAAAPGATIELASCADSTTTFGGLFALQNLVNAGSPPAIMSISYAECESSNGLTANQAYSSSYQQAVAEGVSVYVAAGDWGAAVCDAPHANTSPPYATQGIAVNGFASTAYNVAVGGTDFGEAYARTTSTYWSSTNNSVYGSALSYIPEIPWNRSCASVLIANFEGYSVPYGTAGFCNSSTGANFIDFIAGSGGPSSCAVQQGSGCGGTPKPSWQTGPGVPADGVRDLPDVSLFAAVGPWGHAYVYCDSDGATCSTSQPPSSWSLAGGTSFASPIMAGIQALVNQSTGARQGNPNFVYYTLAASQSGSGLACNATSGNAISGGCVFHDVTLGDMDVVCEGSSNCYLPSGTYGVLSSSNGAYAPAFAAAPGWDFATGLGTVNAANLVKYWTSSDLSLGASGSITSGGLLSYSLTVGDRGPQSASSVVLTTTLPAGFTLVTGMSSAFCTQSGQKVTCTVGALGVGAATPVAIVVMPNGSGMVSLTFAASSANPDLSPADGTATVSLNEPGESPSSDGPLPLWAYVAFGLLLIAIASRRRAPTR